MPYCQGHWKLNCVTVAARAGDRGMAANLPAAAAEHRCLRFTGVSFSEVATGA